MWCSALETKVAAATLDSQDAWSKLKHRFEAMLKHCL
jgi:hypothetical protein